MIKQSYLLVFALLLILPIITSAQPEVPST